MPNNTYIAHYYHYPELVVLAANKDGETKLCGTISKQQRSRHDNAYCLGYASYALPAGLLLVYNEIDLKKQGFTDWKSMGNEDRWESQSITAKWITDDCKIQDVMVNTSGVPYVLIPERSFTSSAGRNYLAAWQNDEVLLLEVVFTP